MTLRHHRRIAPLSWQLLAVCACPVLATAAPAADIAPADGSPAVPLRKVQEPAQPDGASEDYARLPEEARAARQAHINKLMAALAGTDKSLYRQSAWELASMQLPAWQGTPLFTRLLSHPSEDVRLQAISVLSFYGVTAVQAVPELLRLLRGDWRPELAAEALGIIAPHNQIVVRPLIAALGRDNESLTVNAATALGGMGGDGAAAVPALKKLLNSSSVEIQSVAFLALGRLWDGWPLDATPPGLQAPDFPALRQLDMRDPARASALLLSLARQGRGAGGAVPQLHGIIRDRRETPLRIAAVQALAGVGLGAEPALVRLLLQLATGNGSSHAMQRAARAALATLDDRDAALAGPLAEAIGGTDYAAARLAVELLTGMGPGAAPALPAVTERLKSATLSNQQMREYTAILLNARTEYYEASHVLLALLKKNPLPSSKGTDSIVPALLAALCSTGGELDRALCKELTPIVTAALQDQNLAVVAAGARAAGKFPLASDQMFVPLLLPLVRAEYPAPADTSMNGQFDFGWGSPEPVSRQQLAEGRLTWDTRQWTSPRIEAMRALTSMAASARLTLDDLQWLLVAPLKPVRKEQQPARYRLQQEAGRAIERIAPAVRALPEPRPVM